MTIDLHRATVPKVVNHRLSSASDINLGGDTVGDMKAGFGFKKKGRAVREISHDNQTPQILHSSPFPVHHRTDFLDLPLLPLSIPVQSTLDFPLAWPRSLMGRYLPRMP